VGDPSVLPPYKGINFSLQTVSSPTPHEPVIDYCIDSPLIQRVSPRAYLLTWGVYGARERSSAAYFTSLPVCTRCLDAIYVSVGSRAFFGC
jgi:hypothetical protein